MPTLFFLHGADPTFRTPGQLQTKFNQKLQNKVSNLHVIVPDWRAQTMPALGPVNLTVPGGEFEPAQELTFPGADLLRDFKNNLKKATADTALAAVARVLTNHFEKRRPELMEYARDQLLAEVLGYQLYRARVHKFVAQQLDDIPKANGPLVVGGLSLGGIVAVDFLSDPTNADRRQRVKSLVTIGSQSPVLHAFRALPSLISIDPVTDEPRIAGEPFTPWRNVYDPRDFLSFIAAPLFHSEYSDDLDIVDIPRTSKKAFPHSHSGYFEDKPTTTWDTLEMALKAAN